MIESATFKLTLWYLAIVMALSLVFSAVLYRESMTQIVNSTNRQRAAIDRLLPLQFESQQQQFDQYLGDQLNRARQQLLLRLTTWNLVVLILGGGASYLLARLTLRPIEDSLEAQGRFTADASHELRTPLTAMRTEIEVALRAHELEPAAARELLASNLEEIAKLEALSAGLLRLARFENGLDPAAVTTMPVSSLFENATKRLHAPLSARHIKLETQVGSETVAGDRDSLTELIVILLDNAIKYSPPKSTINLRSLASGNHIELSVADHGVGIKASDIPHIFDRFYRADRSRSREQVGGYGLGLSIAARIAEVHRGSITAKSAPEQGSTFTVRLPSSYESAKPPFLSLFSEHTG